VVGDNGFLHELEWKPPSKNPGGVAYLAESKGRKRLLRTVGATSLRNCLVPDTEFERLYFFKVRAMFRQLSRPVTSSITRRGKQKQLRFSKT